MTTIADLRPDPANARRHNPRNVGMIARSLQEVGAARSIVIDEDGTVLAGNGVLEAAADAGIERVQVVDADGETIVAVRRTGLTPEQKQRLALYDNRTAELAEWDADVLAALATDDAAALDGLFTDDELAEVLADAMHGNPDVDAEPQIDRAAELAAEWGTATGQVWRLGDHRLACGDCTDAAVVARVMEGARAGSVVTDPPYGIDRAGIPNDNPAGLRALFDGCLATLPADDAVVIAFQSPRLFPVWLDAARAAGLTFERMLWMYKPNDETYPWRGWLQKSEAIPVMSRGKAAWLLPSPYGHDCYSPTTLGQELTTGQGWHASVKPLAVVSDLLSRVAGDVYDPFVGSGTTIIAAEQLGRRAYCIEIDPGYVAVCLQRYLDATGNRPVLVDPQTVADHDAQ